MAAEPCPWCAAALPAPARAERHVARCPACDVGVTRPWPTAAELDAAYAGAYRPDAGRFGGPGTRSCAALARPWPGAWTPSPRPGRSSTSVPVTARWCAHCAPEGARRPAWSARACRSSTSATRRCTTWRDRTQGSSCGTAWSTSRTPVKRWRAPPRSSLRAASWWSRSPICQACRRARSAPAGSRWTCPAPGPPPRRCARGAPAGARPARRAPQRVARRPGRLRLVARARRALSGAPGSLRCAAASGGPDVGADRGAASGGGRPGCGPRPPGGHLRRRRGRAGAWREHRS